MNKLICVVGLLTLTTYLVAQDIAFEKDHNMEKESKQFLIRWAETTLGFRLSKNEEILHSDNTAILIGLDGHPNKLIANYEFNPALLSASLQLEIGRLKTVILGNFGNETYEDRFYLIPEWLRSLCQLEALVLANAELSSEAFCDGLSLKYLDLQKISCSDKSSFLKYIENSPELQVFIYDESFSSAEILSLKEKLPKLKLVQKL
jgi:hypothetical protein